MEYIVSARKYRPMTFDSVVGQTSLTTTLKNAVTSGKLAHAYLFCGPRGVGKTTCARIFAKAINCLNPTSTGDACGECESCKAFNEGRSLNIFELDAASNNGIEQIKSLMEQTRIPPQTGRYKVFIIDEVHMLSPSAFNAFLKTLEEPPSHVIFILATTEKHKILPTIISRCQIYDFERMTVQGIISHLKNVAEKEGINYEEEALNVIAEKADGGMRDALSIFDQTASFCQGNITYAKVLEDLNVLDADNYFKIIDLALENKISDIMLIFNSLLSRGFDGRQTLNGLASHIRNVLMAHNPQTTQLIEASEAQRQHYAEQAKKCTQKFLYTALKLINQCDISYTNSSNKRLLCELTLIQVAQITQPEEEGEGVGRSPYKRLKSLFKKLLAGVQSTKTAAQVAQAGNTSAIGVVSSDEKHNPADQQTATNNANSHTATATANKPAQSSQTATQIQPSFKLKGLGSSFGNIMHGPEDENKTDEEENKIVASSENETFEIDDLLREWRSMCNRMVESPEYKSLALRMLNVQLKITDYPNVDAIAENTLLLNDVQAILSRIQRTLMQKLHNGHINIQLKLGKPVSFVPKLAPDEFVKKLAEANPSFASFSDTMQLELDI